MSVPPSGSGCQPSASAADASSLSGIPNAGKLEEAIALAVEFHKGQVDKAGAPYILHPLRVMGAMGDDTHRIAAVLHDTVEDCGLELLLIKHRFGAHIADAVDALTRRDDETYDAFIERCGKNSIASVVKLADLADNMDLSRIPFPNDADERRQEKYSRATSKLLEIAAQGTEARRAETSQDGSVHDGPVA